MKKAILIALFFFVSAPVFCQLQEYEDTSYYFSIEYPEDWKPDGKPDHNLRIVLVSPDEKYTLAVYAFYLDAGHYDIEKFAAQDSLLFRGLGETTETDINTVLPFGEYIDWALDGAGEILDIRKQYAPNDDGFHARAFFTVDEHYAYLLMAYSRENNFEVIEEVFDSFEKEAGWLTKFRNDSSWANRKRSMIAFLYSFGAFLLLAGLTYAGRGVKKWSRRRKVLARFRSNLEEGKKPDHKWKYAYRRTLRKIASFILLAILCSLPIAISLYDKWFTFPALILLFFVGYMGYQLVVSE